VITKTGRKSNLQRNC